MTNRTFVHWKFMHKVLTIAGSDSGGGAGIAADLRTFQALGVYGTTAITALTAQNTRGVAAIVSMPAKFVGAQIDSVMSDIGADAWKTGMLATAGIVEAVAVKAKQYAIRHLIVDPVMVSTTGRRLLRREAIGVFVKKLLPLATVITPNIGEAETITGITIRDVVDMEKAAVLINNMGAKHVVIKGGHLSNSTLRRAQGKQFIQEAIDILYDGRRFYEFRSSWIKTRNIHGTGCTFASAIAAEVAKGRSVMKAAEIAKQYVTEALQKSVKLRIGKGNGPVL